MIVHILTPGFTSPNGRAFLFPLIYWRQELLAYGISIKLFKSIKPEIFECELLILDCRFFQKAWAFSSSEVEDLLAQLSESSEKLFWYDNTDSSGFDHARVLPFVEVFLKNQILVNKALYTKPIYANGRVFAEFAHENFGISDENESFSEPITDGENLKKIRVGWNSGIADYSLLGPLKMAWYKTLNTKLLLQLKKENQTFDQGLKIDFSARFGCSYERDSVAWQRKQLRNVFQDRIATNKIRRKQYLKELMLSKVVLSPFGLGEITLKDFEVFRSSAALLKPNLSHMETWPDFFIDGQTMMSFSWDLSDVELKLELLLSSNKKCEELGYNGSRLYQKYTSAPEAALQFVHHFNDLIRRGT